MKRPIPGHLTTLIPGHLTTLIPGHLTTVIPAKAGISGGTQS